MGKAERLPFNSNVGLKTALFYSFHDVSGKEYKGFKYTSSINKNGKYRVIIKYKCVDDDTNYYGTVFYDLTAEKVTE